MKWKITLLMMVTIFVSSWNASAVAAQKSFSDVNASHWAKKEINYLVDKEVINGYPDGRYGINDSITRAQAATMIMRSFGWGTSGDWNDPGYSDVRPGKHWAYNDIAAVYNLDIFKPTGKFQPELAVTRGEMADMLVKAFDLSSIKASKFIDLSHDHIAYKSIHTLAGNQITSGYPDGTFRPDAKVTRAEFAVFMTRIFEESYRLPSDTPADVDGTIYDLEIGDQYYQLEEPLLLTDKWFAPIELFEKMGYYVQTLGDNRIILTSTEGQEIELQVGQDEVWVGETSVMVEEPLKRFNGNYYIEAHGILTALEKPLVFYPDNFLIRLESPKITAADIVEQMPQSAVDVLHSKMPYWHWTKRDRDYLELIRKDDLESKREQLLQEMYLLTQAYFKAEQEKIVIKGITYFSDSVTGKIDAISRGLEARYVLLYQNSSYKYPAAGSSGSIGHFGLGERYEFNYVVYDHLFEHYESNKQNIIHELTTFNDINLELFSGLAVHGIPFSIREVHENGHVATWAGLASGSSEMLVVNSSVDTFYHELGHNWDFKFGDHEEYLKLRGKSGYMAQNNDWASKVEENFAEDFKVAFMPKDYGENHKGVFGMPTNAEIETFRAWVKERSTAKASDSKDELTINGATLLPGAISVADGKLSVQGKSGHHLFATIINLSTGEETTIDFTANGSSFDETLILPAKGSYEVTIGSVKMYVIY